MSQLRLGILPDGTRHVVELEPAYARRQGNGGAALGQAYATFVVHQRKAAGKADATAAAKHRRSA